MDTQNKPLIAVFADVIEKAELHRTYHASGTNYIKAVAEATAVYLSFCQPLVQQLTTETLLENLMG